MLQHVLRLLKEDLQFVCAVAAMSAMLDAIVTRERESKRTLATNSKRGSEESSLAATAHWLFTAWCLVGLFGLGADDAGLDVDAGAGTLMVWTRTRFQRSRPKRGPVFNVRVWTRTRFQRPRSKRGPVFNVRVRNAGVEYEARTSVGY